MNLLILGGTVFLGRHLVGAALAQGHTVTIFTRGRHGADLFPEVEHLRGDRRSDLSALRGRRWDAMIDTSGMVPREVRDSAEMLHGNVDVSAFVSTISVLDTTEPHAAEDAPRPGPETLEDPATDEVTGETYGPLKAGCEDVVREVWGDRALVVRPGLIVGPWDYSGRFSYWPVRFARGGDVLVPAPASAPVQFIDPRDLAVWMMEMVAAGRGGVFNATGPAEPATMGDLVSALMSGVSPAGTEPVWVDEAFLVEQEVVPWAGLPLWIPEAAGVPGFSQVDCRAAIGAGLRFRPLSATTRDTLAWAQAHPELALPVDGMAITSEREAQLLAQWRAGQSGRSASA